MLNINDIICPNYHCSSPNTTVFAKITLYLPNMPLCLPKIPLYMPLIPFCLHPVLVYRDLTVSILVLCDINIHHDTPQGLHWPKEIPLYQSRMTKKFKCVGVSFSFSFQYFIKSKHTNIQDCTNKIVMNSLHVYATQKVWAEAKLI